MNNFAGAVFTQDDTTQLLTIIGVIGGIILLLIIMTVVGIVRLLRSKK